MFCNKANNAFVNRTHKRALRVVYDNRYLSLEELLELDGNVNIQVKNLWSLMVEIYRSLNQIKPEFMWHLFRDKYTPYYLRSACKIPKQYQNTESYEDDLWSTRGFIQRFPSVE